jgi:two-component system, LytTR family, sensor histidine kinase AlgZ
MSDNRQNQGTFLPDFCNARTVFIIIMLAELLAIIISLAQHPYIYTNVVGLAMNSLFIQWVALTCTGILCIFRRKLQHFNDHWVATISYLITMAISFIVTEIAWYVLSEELEFNYFSNNHLIFTVRVMAISAIAWALALRYFYVQHQWRLRVQSESEARFQALQSRIKPHFLFNCMNTIAGLIRHRPALAEESIVDLADLFRASLQETQRICSLGEEISLCRRYLKIEQHRLGDRLKIDWQLNSVPDEITLPVLSIQPLVENAIYHGIEPNPAGGMITVIGKVIDDRVMISIENPVIPQKGGQKPRNGNQLAVDNVRQRLVSYFDQDRLLTVDQDHNYYKVTIILPMLP